MKIRALLLSFVLAAAGLTVSAYAQDDQQKTQTPAQTQAQPATNQGQNQPVADQQDQTPAATDQDSDKSDKNKDSAKDEKGRKKNLSTTAARTTWMPLGIASSAEWTGIRPRKRFGWAKSTPSRLNKA